MLPFAAAVLAARQAAAAHGARATVGKVIAEPGAVNAISSPVTAWLDARAPDESTAAGGGRRRGGGRAGGGGRPRGGAGGRSPSRSPPAVGSTPACATDAGVVAGAHAGSGRRCCRPARATTPGVLAARVPSGMLFVRNPTGVSHSPAEHAEPADCAAGVQALAAVLEDLACR